MGKFTENRDITLTQADFICCLAGSTGHMLKDADFWVKAVKKELIACLMEGNSVKFVEFGTFESRQRAARKLSHNAIVGGKETVCRAKTVAHLTPSKKLNSRLTEVHERYQDDKSDGEE